MGNNYYNTQLQLFPRNFKIVKFDPILKLIWLGLIKISILLIMISRDKIRDELMLFLRDKQLVFKPFTDILLPDRRNLCQNTQVYLICSTT